MRYKISKAHLKLREYGRNVQMMVDYAKTLTSREERNYLVYEIVRIMGSMTQAVKENPDHQRKLWDHLYHLADYDIDIDTDFGMSERREIMARPTERMPYGTARPRFRQYGRNVELMVQEALKIEDPERRLYLINVIANIMRMHLRNSERDSNSELVVMDHIRKLTNGELDYSPDQVRFYNVPPPPPNNSSSRYSNKGGNKHNKPKKKKNYRK